MVEGPCVTFSDSAQQLPRKFDLSVDLDQRTFGVSSEDGSQTIAFDSDEAAALAAHLWKQVGWDTKFVYSFSWHGRPIIQVPDDLVRMQEAFFEVGPDVVIEVGVAHGGSAVFFAGLCAAQERGHVVAVELELRQHNREALDAHPLRKYITFVEGNSIGDEVVDQVSGLVAGKERVMVFLDGNHTSDHVAAELELYAPLVTPGSWMIVADGIMSELAERPANAVRLGRRQPRHSGSRLPRPAPGVRARGTASTFRRVNPCSNSYLLHRWVAEAQDGLMTAAEADRKFERADCCRVCGDELPPPFLDLGNQPLANSFAQAGVSLVEVPLAVTRCPHCTMLQLTHTVDPSVMFTDYAYQSSVSSTWVRHCEQFVDSLLDKGVLGTDSTVVDVASNDGYLLRHLRSRNIRAVGVEPAVNLSEQANREGLQTLNLFMGRETSEQIGAITGPVDLVVANNVLAHVPDPIDFLAGIAGILAPTGLLSVESPHALRLLEGMQFDTVYHEHVFYLTATAVAFAAEQAGLELVDIAPVATHGGSLRMSLAHRGSMPVQQSVADCLDEERRSELLTPAGLQDFGDRVSQLKADVLTLLGQTIQSGARWAAFGAAAKGVVFVNYLGLDSDHLEFVVDNNPLKQGNVMPGTGIPIVPSDHLAASSDITDVLILAWNIANELSGEVTELCGPSIRSWAALPTLHQLS